ncbi:SepM family pheromone-processing serine protease [Falsibacillus pallidus]|uniref:endopeptidase La n=1 Tax=Falsibacillus pallidus TaxID=493781 RepID=A0A370GVL5_9BACI|nr:SepM family pheromone-processing serine protease [Falsibacillus pallidus]RDI47571.1 PDZ domain-containing protein [Falsibacillus pallidus]
MAKKITYRILTAAAILLAASMFINLPYYVTKPGAAHELEPIVHVDGGFDEKGKLMLTTVRMGRANIYSYVVAKVRDFEEIIPEDQLKGEEETDEEYNVRQLYYMENSKNNAIQVAYRAAKKPYHFKYKGIYVLDVYPKMPASKILKAGDRITTVDGHKFESSEQFIAYVQKKSAGDSIKLTYVHDDKEKTGTIKLKEFNSGESEGKVGIGIGLVDDRELISTPPVTMKTDEIGGPSAGLMFSLEIYNQLTKEDLTKGMDIAGTGTISPDGKVGRIGGIQLKVMAADKKGADIFFAPDDEIPPEIKKSHPELQSNYVEAKKAAKEIGTDMKIVPVKTFDDAVEYLNKLSPHK